MFSFFKSDPSKKLRKTLALKLEQAMQAQRRGDMKSYAAITSEAESIRAEIEKLEAKD
jgi:hypothetical protein